MNSLVYLNGDIVPIERAAIGVEDRGYQFADGVYEVIKYYGRRPLRLVPHLERIQRSAKGLRFGPTMSVDEWVGALEDLAVRSEVPDDDATENCVYMQVTRGVAPRNHIFPPHPQAVHVAYFKKAPVYSKEQRGKGIALSSQPDERWNRCWIKSTCLLAVVMAKQAALDAGAFEALLVRPNGIVTEGGATNVYCVRGGEVWTHPEGDWILTGVTRQLVQEAAARAGVAVREQAVTLEEFGAADEAFISSTTMNIMPATKLDGKPVGSGEVGPVTKALVQSLEEIVAEETRGVGAR